MSKAAGEHVIAVAFAYAIHVQRACLDPHCVTNVASLLRSAQGKR